MRKISLLSGSEVVEKELEWLWYPYIPKNKACILSGFPGEGKSTMTVDIMAALTNAKELPECTIGMEEDCNRPIIVSPTARNILYINAEDGLEDTTIPRLRKAGADLERCKFLPKGFLLGNEKMCDYLEILRSTIQDYAIKLVVIDPLNSNLPSDVSSRGGDKLNKLLTGISSIAEDEDCAFILITHLVKAARKKEEIDMSDVLGATSVVGTVRIGLLVEEQSYGPAKRKILRHIKSNISAQDKAINFYLENGGLFSWGAFFSRKANRFPSDINTAKQYIHNALSKTKLSWKNLEALRKEFYVSDSTWKRARQELGCVCDFENKQWGLPEN